MYEYLTLNFKKATNVLSSNVQCQPHPGWLLVQTMARLYAQALFLLTDHHSMYVVHDHLVGFLAMEGRVEEAAYHSHEKLVILLSILGRCTPLLRGPRARLLALSLTFCPARPLPPENDLEYVSSAGEPECVRSVL